MGKEFTRPINVFYSRLSNLETKYHVLPCRINRRRVFVQFFHSLKGLFTNFEYITFFSCPTKRNIFCKRSISIKPLWLEIIEKKVCTKSVRVIYIIYIIVLGRTDFVHPLFSIISSQSGFIEMDLSQKMFLMVGHEKMLYIQNWWTIPLSTKLFELN